MKRKLPNIAFEFQNLYFLRGRIVFATDYIGNIMIDRRQAKDKDIEFDQHIHANDLFRYHNNEIRKTR